MPEAAIPAAASPPRRSWRRVVWWVLGLVVLFVVGGFFAVPPLLKEQLERALADATGRAASVGRVTFNPFTWKATLTDFTLQDRVAGPPLLTLREVVADVSSASVWHRAPVFDALRIVDPRVHLVRRPDGSYNIQDLVDRALAESPGSRPSFSLNNIEVAGGGVTFDDQPHARQHAITGIELAIPFLSSLPVDVTVNVVPKLRATVNGTPFALDGTTTPFASPREASLDVNLDALPLPAYVTYAPVKPNVRLVRGALTTRLRIVFREGEGAQRSLHVTGDARLDDLAATRADGASLVAFERAVLTLADLDVLARRVDVAAVAVTAPQVDVRRDRAGAFEWQQPLFDVPPPTAPAPAAPAPWTLVVRKASATGAAVRIADEAVTPAFRATLSDVVFDATDFATTPDSQASLSVRAKSDLGATLALDAKLDPGAPAMRGHAEIAQLHLAKLYPYYADALNLEVGSGTIDFAGDFAFAQPGGKPQLTLTGGVGALADLRLALPGERLPLWRMPHLGLREVTFDLAAQKVEIGEIVTRGAQGNVRREADGSLNWARLLKTTAATGKGDADTWSLLVRRAQFSGYAIDVDDHVPAPAVLFKLRGLTGTFENFTNARGKRGTMNLRAQVGDTGRIAVQGAMATNPVAANVALDATGLALASLQPYLDGFVNVTVTRGTLAAKGRLTTGVPDGAGANTAARATFAGDVTVADFAALDKPTASDLAKWRSLVLTGVDLGTAPPKLAIGAIALDDFYARVIVYNDATLNLARLLTPGAAPEPSGDAAVAALTPGPGTTTAAGAASAPVATPRRDALPIAIGRIELARGNVQFSDFFVQPNYSANLTDVAGTVSAMSPTEAGDIALAARVDRTAPVEIKGRLQPFAAELSLDLAGSARDIELPPLSPYAAKYAGYGIEKGKLSFDVAYKIENRKLEARNKLVLDQLTFGARVDSPTATKLPVLLAVALLKDRRGVIDIELPIAGSLDDPQFSVGGLIVRVIVNLITKAVTAPFALLGALAGGGAELSYVEFAPGSAVPAAAGDAKLASLAKALADRPGLKLEIGGRVEPVADRAALEAAAFDTALKAQKMKTLAAGGSAPESVAAGIVTAEERPALLVAAYRDAPIAERPRNMLGMLSDVPPAQMEALLRKHTTPGDEALRELANARAQAAKEALVTRGVAADRLFILAPKLDANGVKEGAPTRVDFALR